MLKFKKFIKEQAPPTRKEVKDANDDTFNAEWNKFFEPIGKHLEDNKFKIGDRLSSNVEDRRYRKCL